MEGKGKFFPNRPAGCGAIDSVEELIARKEQPERIVSGALRRWRLTKCDPSEASFTAK